MKTKPSEEEIIAAVRKWGNNCATYVVRNRLSDKHKGLDTPWVLRRLKALEKVGKVARVPTNYAVMICWAALP